MKLITTKRDSTTKMSSLIILYTLWEFYELYHPWCLCLVIFYLWTRSPGSPRFKKGMRYDPKFILQLGHAVGYISLLLGTMYLLLAWLGKYRWHLNTYFMHPTFTNRSVCTCMRMFISWVMQFNIQLVWESPERKKKTCRLNQHILYHNMHPFLCFT